ncbi:MAG TPA: S1 family peptidase [Amycolatopsis sp.]|nr:S1 family peptidase [Amycolatopsis sp.]
MRPQLSWRKRLLAVGILPIVVAALIVPPAAHASGTSGTSQSAKDGWQRSLAQRPLVVAAEKLQAAIRRDHHAGFAGITLSDNEVVLWWKGDPPAGIVAEATLVRIARAAYSHTELERAAAGIRTGSQSVRVRADGSGLDLVTDQIAVAPPKSDVPVTVVHRERPRLASRHDDWSPWGGGSTIWNQTGGWICTSGFGVRNSAGQKFILTAAHCGETGDTFADGTGEYIGQVSTRKDQYDQELIPASDASNEIYVGGTYDDTVTTVVGWGEVFVGQWLCQSGQTSADETGGPVCDLQVTSTDGGSVEAMQVDGQEAARSGDSGGPVYSAGDGGVIANGTTTALCCGNYIYFHPFSQANEAFGVYIP